MRLAIILGEGLVAGTALGQLVTGHLVPAVIGLFVVAVVEAMRGVWK